MRAIFRSIIIVSIASKQKISIERVEYLQTTGESGRFVLDDRGLGWLAHNNKLLVGLHYNASELWKPDANMHKTLQAKFHL